MVVSVIPSFKTETWKSFMTYYWFNLSTYANLFIKCTIYYTIYSVCLLVLFIKVRICSRSAPCHSCRCTPITLTHTHPHYSLEFLSTKYFQTLIHSISSIPFSLLFPSLNLSPINFLFCVILPRKNSLFQDLTEVPPTTVNTTCTVSSFFL